ncbi:MAG: Fe-S cluster assembly protein SufD [Gemmatimonadetes bacterium]|nr:Fe-S cluster assembly protein SufD [Gemmatimonadota bacterium]
MSGNRSQSYERAALDRFAAEPAWLREQRALAFAAFERLPLPTTRSEEWRYTDPAQLRWDQVRLAALDSGTSCVDRAKRLLTGKLSAGRVIQCGAHIADIVLPEELRARGVILMDLAEAAREHGMLVESHLARALPLEAGKFAALNTAFWSAGVFLFVPAGVRIDAPVRIIRWVENGGLAYFPRTLVVAGAGSEFGLVEEFASPDLDDPAFSNGAVEVFASPGSRVRYVALQRWGRNMHHLSMQRTVAQRDANLDSLVVNLGATVARVELHAALRGPGARSDMLGLYFAQEDEHFDHSTRQDHEVPHANSDLLYKGALDGRSRAIFRGLIKVFPKAQRTDAYQTNRNLILSRQAEATSLPNLEIEADDVRCSHAATVGQLDDDELFYIMSRGVPRPEAERLVVFGFFGEVLERLPIPTVVHELREAIERKIRK